MTETLMITSNPYDGRATGRHGRASRCRGSRSPSRTTSEILVRGPNVFDGYWDDRPPPTSFEPAADGGRRGSGPATSGPTTTGTWSSGAD